MAASFRPAFLLLALLAAVPVHAQVPPADSAGGAAASLLDTTFALPPLTVEAPRETTSTLAAPARLTTLDRQALAATAAQSVADVLAMRTGLFVKRYGAGGPATASLRGTGSTQTLVLLDGHRVADPQSGQVDLTLLPAVLLEGIEVAHGARAARYGSGSLGGVVRLRTLRPTSGLHLKLTGEAGAFGQRSAGAVASGRRGLLSGLLAAEASRAEGDFPYVNETLVPPRRMRRANADRALSTLFGKLRYDGARWDLGGAAWYSHVERGLPGAASAALGNGSPASIARQGDEHMRLMARGTRRFGWGTLQLDGSAQQSTQRYADPESLFSEGDTSRTRSYALEAFARLPVSEALFVEAGLATGLDEAALRGGLHRWRLGPFLGGTLRHGRLAVHPALRLDTYFSSGKDVVALSPSLGLSVQPLAWEGLRLKGSVGRAFRAPTFGERFSRPGGNPGLEAETGWSAETGLALALRGARYGAEAELTAFALHLDEQIVWQPSYVAPGLQVWRPENVARVATRGLEASLRGRLQPAPQVHLGGGFYFTHTCAENRSHPAARSYGKQLAYVPRQQLKLHLSAAWQALRLDVSARLVGRRYTTSDETQHLAPYRVVDVQLRYAHRLGPVEATLGLTIENAFDRDYGIVRFYPMPPRHARLRLTLATAP